MDPNDSNTKYQLYDFIRFNNNFFSNNDNNPINEEYVGLILQKYFKYNSEEGRYIQYYDILFEKELWRLEVDDVDANNKTEKITRDSTKRDFLKTLKNRRMMVTHLLKKFGIKASNIGRVTRKKVTNTDKTTRKTSRKSKRKTQKESATNIIVRKTRSKTRRIPYALRSKNR